VLLYVRRGAWLKSERNHGAVAAVLHFYIGKTMAANCFGARNIGYGNLDIESIAAAIRFVITQRLI